MTLVLARKRVAKRKRYSGEDYGMAIKRSGVYGGVNKPPTRMFRAGRDRTVGYYGRYSHASGFGHPGELKFHDLIIGDVLVDTNGTIIDSINKIAQGVTEVQRIGRKCTLRSVHFRTQYSLATRVNQAGLGTGDSIRLIVFVDKQCNGATALVTDILETTDIQSFRNLVNSGRFVFLYDKVHTVNYLTMGIRPDNNFAQDGVKKWVQWNAKCEIPVEFSDTTGAITEIRSNNIGHLLISESGTARYDTHIRVRFSDN